MKWNYTSIYVTQFWVYEFQKSIAPEIRERVSSPEPSLSMSLLLVAEHLNEQLLLARHVQLLVDVGNVLVRRRHADF